MRHVFKIFFFAFFFQEDFNSIVSTACRLLTPFPFYSVFPQSFIVPISPHSSSGVRSFIFIRFLSTEHGRKCDGGRNNNNNDLRFQKLINFTLFLFLCAIALSTYPTLRGWCTSDRKMLHIRRKISINKYK